MALFKQLAVAVAALLLSVTVAATRPVTEAEQRALTETVQSFNAAMKDSDFPRVVATIPPRVLEHIAKSGGVDVETLKRVVTEQMKAALAQVKLEAFSMDLDKADHRELPNGEPYLLVPTETLMSLGDGQRFKATSHTLALLDGGAWYLLRIDEAQQVAIMRQVYPEFAEVEFPSGSMEALKE